MDKNPVQAPASSFIFVFGFHHSGTSITEETISQCSNVASRPRSVRGRISELHDSEYETYIKSNYRNSSINLSKTPTNRFWQTIGLLYTIYSYPIIKKIVYTYRDPANNIYSLLKRKKQISLFRALYNYIHLTLVHSTFLFLSKFRGWNEVIFLFPLEEFSLSPKKYLESLGVETLDPSQIHSPPNLPLETDHEERRLVQIRSGIYPVSREPNWLELKDKMMKFFFHLIKSKLS